MRSLAWGKHPAGPDVCGVCVRACSECAPGYYRLVQSCVPCPKGAFLLLAGYALAIVLFIVAAGVAHRKRVNMSALGIGVDFLQVGCGAEQGCSLRRPVLPAAMPPPRRVCFSSPLCLRACEVLVGEWLACMVSCA
jgi:hypothetical protein